MSTLFRDGPAASQMLNLERSPIFLRVTQRGDKFDALDKIDDSPFADEAIHVYKRNGPAHRMHVRRQGGGGWQSIAAYDYLPTQPPEEIVRNTDRWQAWCRMQSGRGE